MPCRNSFPKASTDAKGLPLLRWLPLRLCDVGCTHCRNVLALVVLELSQSERTRSRNKGNGITTRESQRPCLVGSGCLLLPLPQRPCLGCSLNSLRERAKNQQPAGGKESQRGNRNALALWLCDVCCSHCRNVLALVASGTHRGDEPTAATEGTESATRESERSCLAASGCLLLPLPQRPCLGCSLNSLRERAKNQQPTGGKESQRGNRNALALVGVRCSDGCRCWFCDVGCSHYCERSCLGCS